MNSLISLWIASAWLSPAPICVHIAHPASSSSYCSSLSAIFDSPLVFFGVRASFPPSGVSAGAPTSASKKHSHCDCACVTAIQLLWLCYIPGTMSLIPQDIKQPKKPTKYAEIIYRNSSHTCLRMLFGSSLRISHCTVPKRLLPFEARLLVAFPFPSRA